MPDDVVQSRPLFSTEAESAVIGGLLLAGADAWDVVQGIVSDSDFRSAEHRAIFRALATMVAAREPIDTLTVVEKLKSLGKLEEAGGFAYINELVISTPTAANVKRYAEIVRDLSTLSRVAAAGRKIHELVMEPSGLPAADVLDRAQSMLSSVAALRAHGRGEPTLISRYVMQALTEVDDAAKNVKSRGVAGLSSGLKDLDFQLGGFMAGDLIVIGGRPGMGKSALALNVVRHAAMQHKTASCVFSMEMRGAQLAKRLLADLSNMHGLRLSHGRIQDEEWEQLGRVAPTLSEQPIWICEDGGLTISELTAGARKFRREAGNAGLIVVDYFTLMSIERPSSNHAQDLSKISSALKALAKELALPVLLLAQVSREVERRGDKRPILSDLRDSGGLEQDADTVIFVYRDHHYHPDSANESDAELLIRKQRSGPTRDVRVKYDGPRTRFMDWDALP